MPPFCGVNSKDSKIMHLSFAFSWFDPPDTPRNPTELMRNGTVSVWHFFFPRRGGEFFSFGNEFGEPREHTHEICSSFGKRYIDIDQSVFALFYFTLMPNFDIMMWVFTDTSP